MVRNAIYKWICDDKQSKLSKQAVSAVNKCLGNLHFIMAVILLYFIMDLTISDVHSNQT